MRHGDKAAIGAPLHISDRPDDLEENPLDDLGRRLIFDGQR
jgi:hypothetical protein